MKKRLFSKILAVAIAVSMCVVSATSVLGISINGLKDKLTEIEENISSLENDSKKADTQINKLKGNIEKEKEKQKILDEKQAIAAKQVVLYENKVMIVQENIDQNEKEIKTMKKEIAKNEKLFLKRVRAMYMSSQSSVLSAILGAEDLSDFLTRTEVLKRVSKHDTELIETLTTQKDELLVLKQELVDKKADLDSTKKKYENKSSELQKLSNFSAEAQKALKSEEKAYMLEKERLAKEIKKSDAEIDNILDQIRKKQIEEARIAREKAEKERLEQEKLNAANGNNSGNSNINNGTSSITGGTEAPQGAFAWPLPGYASISSGYGYRTLWGRTEFHYGIDIPAPSGTAIVAANDGVVVLSRYSSGYGNYIVVDHGGGYMTLYAHASALWVSEGQTVSRGQSIAGVGTTGPSTGNHLHFEVRVEGAKQNPLGYVRAPY